MSYREVAQDSNDDWQDPDPPICSPDDPNFHEFREAVGTEEIGRRRVCAACGYTVITIHGELVEDAI